MAKLRREDDDGEFRESIPSEVEDQESSPVSFEIVTYPADFTLLGLYDKIDTGEIVVPKFQRKFVWKQKQSSRLIESFILGIPVPPIFLFVRSDGKHWVVDGQQRLKSIAFFISGLFGDPTDGSRDEFRLILDEGSPYNGKTYAELEATDPLAYRRLNNAVLRSLVVKQLKPNDDTSIYHIFERLNTGGTSLVGQEIRNCIYHGSFNDLLLRLNNPPGKKSSLPQEWKDSVANWRAILGKPKADTRQRDVELILRFFALHDDADSYKKPMKDFLNSYMNRMRNAGKETIDSHGRLFQKTVNAIQKSLGPKPFHIHAGLNSAVFDSVFLAFASNLNRVPRDIKARFAKLKKDATYTKYVTAATTDDMIVPKRVARAKSVLFGK